MFSSVETRLTTTPAAVEMTSGNLCHQPVPDGQQRVVLGRRRHIQIMLQDSDDEPTNDIDEQNHDPCHGISAHKLAGPIHGPIKIRFLGNIEATLTGFFLTDQTGIEIGIDGHLFTGHGIQGKTGAHLSNSARSFGDHDKVDDHQDQENHDPHCKIPPHQKVSKGLDDLPRRIRPGMPFQQYDPGGGHIQGQTQQRGHQQDCRKGGKLEGFQRIHADQQHHDRNGDVEGKKDIQQKGRQRQHHHAQHQNDENGTGQSLASGSFEQTLNRHQRIVHDVLTRFSGSSSSGTGRF